MAGYISVDDVNEILMQCSYVDDYDYYVVDVNKAIEKIKDLPPALNWTLCDNTDDEPQHEVLCCDKYGNEMIGYLSYLDDQWLCESDTELMYDPIAWMDLPTPYQE